MKKKKKIKRGIEITAKPKEVRITIIIADEVKLNE